MSLNIPPPRPSVSERRGQQLAPLQTNFSRPNSRPLVVPSRPQRPRPEEYQVYGETDRVPLNAPAKRQSSKSSLRTIFTRDKQPRRPHDKPLSGIDEAQNPTPQAAAPLSPPPTAATSKRTISNPSVVASPTRSEAAHLTKIPSASQVRPSEDGAPTGDVIWKPPPLFQAYPQALKHDTLPAPVLSADSILRIHATSMAKYRDETAHSHRDDSAEDIAARKKKEDKERSKHLRSLSGTISKAEWTKKVFVLATSGYIMQYSGSGKHDRLPEKVLQLGPASVAFASDAIPGKHWVLQISHTAEANDPTTEAPRPRFARFGFHRSHTRRLAHSFLLVFTSPEDMSSWLLAVRAQIEARGGKKYVSEKVFDEDMEHELHPKLSVRQPAKRDPNRFSQVYLQPQQLAAPDDRESQSDAQSRQGSNISLHRRSFVRQHTSDSRSPSVSTTHTDVTSPINNGSGRFYGPTTDSNSNSPGTTSSASVLANHPATRSISPPPLNISVDSSMRASMKPPVHHPATRPTSPPNAPLNMPVQPSMHVPMNPSVHPSAYPATHSTTSPMHAPLNMPVQPSMRASMKPSAHPTTRSMSPTMNASLNMPVQPSMRASMRPFPHPAARSVSPPPNAPLNMPVDSSMRASMKPSAHSIAPSMNAPMHPSARGPMKPTNPPALRPISPPMNHPSHSATDPPRRELPKASAIETVLSSLDEYDRPRSPTSTGPKKRQSLYMMHAAAASDTPETPRSQSTVPEPFRSASPPAPNFSVPSFSRRFGPATPYQGTHTPRQHVHRQGSNNDMSGSVAESLSPPQSPGRSIYSGMSNSGLSNIQEPQWKFQDNPKRRSLRMANSEDALSETLRHHGSGNHRLSRMLPSNIITSTPSPRFPTFADDDPESPYGDMPTPQLPPANGDPYYYDPPRPRPPPSHQADPSRLSMGPVARRKSMPGLSVGPPAAPPPNCPLPKIPSPLQASHTHFPSPPRHDNMPTSPPRDPRARRKSIARPAHPTRAPAPDMRVASSGHARV